MPEMFMEDVRSISLNVLETLSDSLEELQVDFTEDEVDEVYEFLWAFLERKSNGIYRHHN